MNTISRQFLLYVACSAAAAIANLAVGFILIDSFGFTSSLRYPVAVGIGYCSGMAVNFLLNRHFTFHGSDRTKIQQGRTFLIVALSGLLLTSGIATLVRAIFPLIVEPSTLRGAASGVNVEMIGQVVAIGLVSVYSFTAHRYLTFNRGIRFQLLRIIKLGSARSADG